METRISSARREVLISPERPTVLIGERINPTGRKRLAEALRSGDFRLIRQEALSQVEAGADVLDINVGVSGLNEPDLMARTVENLLGAVEVPFCLDSNSPAVLKGGLLPYVGKALINSRER